MPQESALVAAYWNPVPFAWMADRIAFKREVSTIVKYPTRFVAEEVKTKLQERLKAQKFQENLNALISQLREKANIEILISAKELLNP